MKPRWIGPEINSTSQGGVLIVGRDPGAQEMSQGRPFVGDAGDMLNTMLSANGIDRLALNIANVVGTQPPGNKFEAHRPEDVARGIAELHELVAKLLPNVIITLGNEASWALVGAWPGGKDGQRGTIFGARDIARRRGYFWDASQGTVLGSKVLSTFHPSAVMRDASGISEMLSTYDIGRAWAERHSPKLDRPAIQVEVIRTIARGAEVYDLLYDCKELACDIEITRSYPYGVLCVGFAAHPSVAYVFTQPALVWAYRLLRDKEVGKIWQNGQFDLHFLLTRAGVRVAGPIDDIIVAWHSRWPEIAGAKVDVDNNKKGAKATRKSLAFFASLYTKAPWWKDYDTDEEGMAVLCGRDCSHTLTTHLALQEELSELGLTGIYKETCRRIWPVAEMQARGVLVDQQRRGAAIAALESRRFAAIERLRELARPLLTEYRDRLTKPKLIWERKVCPCCRNGKGKRSACTGCAGLTTQTKTDYLALAGRLGIPISAKMTTNQLKEALLRPCIVCRGQGAWEEYAFNPASSEQLEMLLYDVLKLPRRKGVDEATIKGLLGGVRALQSDILGGADRQSLVKAG